MVFARKVRSVPTRFCGKSCSAIWRSRIYPVELSPESRAKAVAGRLEWLAGDSESAKEERQRFKALCPMTNPESVKKLKATLKRIGHKVKHRGGNGKPIPDPQEIRR